MWERLTGIAEAVAKAFSTLWNNLQDGVGVLLQKAKAWLDGFRQWLEEAWRSMADAVGAAVRWLEEKLKELGQAVLGGLKAVADWLRQGLESAAGAIAEAFRWLVNQVRGALEWIWGNLKAGFESLVGGLKAVFDVTAQALMKIYETLSQIPSLIMKSIEQLGVMLRQAVEAILNGIRATLYFLAIGAKTLISVLLAPPSLTACMLRDVFAELQKQVREAGPAGFEAGCKAWERIRDELIKPLVDWVAQAEAFFKP